jgi:putative FmdB family regulatory protein
MPTYEYQCDACKHHFEELQSFSEAPLTKCPKCKKKKLQRLIGMGAAILFKGAGFYQTDYRSESYKSAAKADAPAPAADKSSKDTTTTPSVTKDTSGPADGNKGKSAGKKAKS